MSQETKENVLIDLENNQMKGINPNTKLILLDLDNTIIFSYKKDNPYIKMERECDFEFAVSFYNEAKYCQETTIFCSYVRPGVKDFLDKCIARGWKIGIWSASTKEYVDIVEQYIFVDMHVEIKYSRNNCKYCNIKINNRLNSPTMHHKIIEDFCKDNNYLENDVVLIDDSELICEVNGENAINIEPWYGGDINDNGLEIVFQQLSDKWN